MSPATKQGKKTSEFSADEKAAMKARILEEKAIKTREAGEKQVKDALARMPGASRAMGQRLHEIITKAAPALLPRTWYGMPAYSSGESVVVFFRNPEKFKERYATLGFNPDAKLDDGRMWPIVFALTELTAAEEARIAALVRKAVG